MRRSTPLCSCAMFDCDLISGGLQEERSTEEAPHSASPLCRGAHVRRARDDERRGILERPDRRGVDRRGRRRSRRARIGDAAQAVDPARGRHRARPRAPARDARMDDCGAVAARAHGQAVPRALAQPPRPRHQQVRLVAGRGPQAHAAPRRVWQQVGGHCQVPTRAHRQRGHEPLELCAPPRREQRTPARGRPAPQGLPGGGTYRYERSRSRRRRGGGRGGDDECERSSWRRRRRRRRGRREEAALRLVKGGASALRQGGACPRRRLGQTPEDRRGVGAARAGCAWAPDSPEHQEPPPKVPSAPREAARRGRHARARARHVRDQIGHV